MTLSRAAGPASLLLPDIHMGRGYWESVGGNLDIRLGLSGLLLPGGNTMDCRSIHLDGGDRQTLVNSLVPFFLSEVCVLPSFNDRELLIPAAIKFNPFSKSEKKLRNIQS